MLLAFMALGALVHLHRHLRRWKFCKSYCPIGVYPSAV